MEELVKHLSNFLDEFEAHWDREPGFTSPEHLDQYISAALYMERNHGRKINRVRSIMEYVDKNFIVNG